MNFTTFDRFSHMTTPAKKLITVFVSKQVEKCRKALTARVTNRSIGSSSVTASGQIARRSFIFRNQPDWYRGLAGQVGHGLARPGAACRGRRGWSAYGKAWYGAAGMARYGEACCVRVRQARLVGARHGMARQARHGSAWFGAVWQAINLGNSPFTKHNQSINT